MVSSHLRSVVDLVQTKISPVFDAFSRILGLLCAVFTRFYKSDVKTVVALLSGLLLNDLS